jgi:RHS repeat-associated protein
MIYRITILLLLYFISVTGTLRADSGISQINNSFNQNQNAFLLGDINLAEGTVCFSETDLVLPGKNGLDLTISRTYSSRSYQSESNIDLSSKKQWGAWAGKGWSFNFAIRAFIYSQANFAYKIPKTEFSLLVEDTNDRVPITILESNNNLISEKKLQKIIIDSGTNLESYEYVGGKYKSSQPGNFKIASYSEDESTISLTTTTGLTYKFSEEFYYESKLYRKDNATDQSLLVKGFLITEISDLFGNKISFSYETLSISSENNNKDIKHIIGDPYEEMVSSGYTSFGTYSRTTQLRPTRITDSFGREVIITYESSRNSSTKNRNAMATGISYKNTNGKQLEIKYSYDVNGNLTAAQHAEIPIKTYSYTKYNPDFHMYYFQLYSYGGKFGEAYTVLYDDHPLTSNRHARQISNIDTGLDKFEGYLLTEKINELGSSVIYEYQSNMHSLDVSEHKIKQRNPLAKDGVILVSTAHPNATFPILNKKIVKESAINGNEYEYSLKYPLGVYNHPVKARYTPQNSSANSYYFSEVEIDNPRNIATEKYIFDKALVTNYIKGNLLETVTEWNYIKNIRTKVIVKKNNIIQTQTEYQDYDEYNHARKIILKKDNDVFQTTIVNYSSRPNHINKNLLHIVDYTTTTDQEGKSRTVSNEYTEEGRVYKSYKGIGASRILLKTHLYDDDGRVKQIREKTTNENDLVIDINYYEPGILRNTYNIEKIINGNITKKNMKKFDRNCGKLIETDGFNGKKVTFIYDDYGRITRKNYPENNPDTYIYSDDLKSTAISSGGRETTKITDGFGRIVIVNNPPGEEDIKYTYYIGNKVSNISKGTYPSIWQQITSNEYDEYLRVKMTSNLYWGATEYNYNDSSAENKVTIIKTSLPDASGYSSVRTTESEYDKLGRKVAGNYLNTGLETTKVYDGFGNLINIIDPKGLQHKTDYNSYGKITKIYNTAQSHITPSLAADMQYFDNGLIKTIKTKETNGNNYKIYSYIYDNESRQKELKISDITKETLLYDESSGENGKGRLTTAINEQVKTNYKYDEMGRITEKKINIFPINKEYRIRTRYNMNGYISKIIYDDNKEINYTYKPYNQRLDKIIYDNKQIATYDYNQNGTIDKITFGSGIILNYKYEKEILLNRITATKPNGQIIYEQSYSFDNSGNISNTTHTDYFNYGSDVTREYKYTQNDELEEVVINSNIAYTYNYDQNGNHLRYETANNKNLSFNNVEIDANADRITKKTMNDGRYLQLEYDAEGNVKSKYRKDSCGNTVETVRYSYNYQGQLEQVQEDNEPRAKYFYNHKGERVYSWLDNYNEKIEKYYYWDQSGRIIGEGQVHFQIRPEQNCQKEHIVRYIYSGNEKLAMARPDWNGNETIYYFINNAQGTPILIVDENGVPASKINMDEWGNLGTRRIGSSNEINFTGKKLDKDTNLYYFNQRYYDPEIGRFLTPDPAGQNLNPYIYCANNPLSYVDPDGEWIWLVGMAIGAYAGGNGKDLSKASTWVDIAFGAAIGAGLGAGADFLVAATEYGGASWKFAFDPGFGLGALAIAEGDLFSGNIHVSNGNLGLPQMNSMWSVYDDMLLQDSYQEEEMWGKYASIDYDDIPGQNLAKQATLESKSKYPRSSWHNGIGDAYRHARWHQLTAEKYGSLYAKSISLAHEIEGVRKWYKLEGTIFQKQLWKEVAMDIYNNKVGRKSAGRNIPINKLRRLKP